MKFVSFFSGISGFELGLERAGHECVGQVEIEPYCNRVLEKHWPGLWRHDDITTLDPERIPAADLWCGGFPCQDISNAGKREGITGKRSGLWSEFARIICELRPRYVIVENVAALLVRGMGTVLRDLAALGYDAEWQVLPASAFGAPHGRDRLFIVAYPTLYGIRDESSDTVFGAGSRSAFSRVGYGGSPVGRSTHALPQMAWNNSTWQDNGARQAGSPVVGMDDGVPNRVDRLKQLGNAVVPQVAQWLGTRLLEAL